jgi:hypothetical protein
MGLKKSHSSSLVFAKLSYISSGLKKGYLKPQNRGECRKAIRVGPTKSTYLLWNKTRKTHSLV